MVTTKQVKELADRLISTLDSLMPSEKADAIVRDVAVEIYRDLLGIDGDKACLFVIASVTSYDFEGYSDPAKAYQGHLQLCKKWASKSAADVSEED